MYFPENIANYNSKNAILRKMNIKSLHSRQLLIVAARMNTFVKRILAILMYATHFIGYGFGK